MKRELQETALQTAIRLFVGFAIFYALLWMTIGA